MPTEVRIVAWRLMNKYKTLAHVCPFHKLDMVDWDGGGRLRSSSIKNKQSHFRLHQLKCHVQFKWSRDGIAPLAQTLLPGLCGGTCEAVVGSCEIWRDFGEISPETGTTSGSASPQVVMVAWQAGHSNGCHPMVFCCPRQRLPQLASCVVRL